MNFLSNLASSTPGVGHIKGLYHYARGDEKKGDEAMYKSTRTSAVIAGGIFGGPPGAIGAGLATDAAASVLMKEEKGLVNNCKNIGEDFAAKRNPTRSILSTGFQLGLDGISGCGGSSGGMSNASKSVFGKTMQRGGGEIIQKSVRISSAEAAKMVARKSSERVAANALQRAFLASAHVGLTAAQRTEIEERERREREWEEWREREERDREWRERREREESEREWREREQSDREWWERKESDREWWGREESEREWWGREESEREWWGREESEREWREREEREREWREREESEREWREWREWIEREQREQREREWREQQSEIEWSKQQQRKRREQEQRANEQKKSKEQEEFKKKEQRANSEKQKRDTSGSGLGSESSQPPDDDKDKKKKSTKKNEPSFFETFMELLRRILKLVYGNETEPFSSIFESLPSEQRKYLAKVLKPVRKFGTLEVVIELVIRMFKQHLPRDISYLNFLSLLEFIQAYIADELLERTRISRGTQTPETKITENERKKAIISDIVNEKDITDKLISLFNGLKTEIKAETAKWNPAHPNFRDIYAAVYHYYKHRRVPHYGRILSVQEYYDWVRMFLEEFKQTHKFTEVKDSKVDDYVREVFVPIFRRRFKIVVKFHNGKVVLSSAYVVTMMHLDDMEKHCILMLADLSTMIYMAISFVFILKYVLSCVPMLLINTSVIVFNCMVFMLKLPFIVLVFLVACIIFLLKVFLNILLLFTFFWFIFFYLPDKR